MTYYLQPRILIHTGLFLVSHSISVIPMDTSRHDSHKKGRFLQSRPFGRQQRCPNLPIRVHGCIECLSTRRCSRLPPPHCVCHAFLVVGERIRRSQSLIVCYPQTLTSLSTTPLLCYANNGRLWIGKYTQYRIKRIA
jgi:hypothetical protein